MVWAAREDAGRPRTQQAHSARETEAEQHFKEIDSDETFVEKSTAEFLKLQRIHRTDRFAPPSQLRMIATESGQTIGAIETLTFGPSPRHAR
jgi:hypothetical protein